MAAASEMDGLGLLPGRRLAGLQAGGFGWWVSVCTVVMSGYGADDHGNITGCRCLYLDFSSLFCALDQISDWKCAETEVLRRECFRISTFTARSGFVRDGNNFSVGSDFFASRNRP